MELEYAPLTSSLCPRFVSSFCADRVKRFEESLAEAKSYILENGRDPEEIVNWKWS